MDPNLAEHVPGKAPSHKLLLFGWIIVLASIGRDFGRMLWSDELL